MSLNRMPPEAVVQMARHLIEDESLAKKTKEQKARVQRIKAIKESFPAMISNEDAMFVLDMFNLYCLQTTAHRESYNGSYRK